MNLNKGCCKRKRRFLQEKPPMGKNHIKQKTAVLVALLFL